MELTVLVDNNTLIDRYFRAEPGLSLLIEDQDTQVLFDTGYSDLFLSNAAKMGKDLSRLDFLVISHSHLDHTRGLEPFVRYLTERKIENLSIKGPALVGHPDIFTSAGMDTIPEFGTLISKEKMARHLDLQLSQTPVQLGPRLIFLGEIPRDNSFEGQITFGKKQGQDSLDLVMDDSALVYKSQKGLVIITGCSHAGICNIIAYAQKVCNEKRVADIIGGFHLLNPSKKQLEGTLNYFKTLNPDAVHACHCTDLGSKIALSRVADVKEVGVGLSIQYDKNS
ncbi:MAG: MBL fold metallo-hydrolase [Desulfobacteraceae bacterium]|nr:MBL fold metallo-hydrolase [Desulfobacteraceae bacterium]